MNQGPRWYCLMKKNRGRKSRDTVSLSRQYIPNVLTGRTKQLKSSFPTHLHYPSFQEVVQEMFFKNIFFWVETIFLGKFFD
jgi:hypothetical protein